MTGPAKTVQAEENLAGSVEAPEPVAQNAEEKLVNAPETSESTDTAELVESNDLSADSELRDDAPIRSGCSTFVSLINGKFDFSVQPNGGCGADIIASNSHCALFIENKATVSLINYFQQQVREESDESSDDSPLFTTGQIQMLQEPLLSRLKNKAADEKVILTEKSRDSAEITARAIKYVQSVADRMKFDDKDRKLVQTAATVYFSIKYRRFDSSPLNQNTAADPSILETLTAEPRVQRSLSLLYAPLTAERLSFKSVESRAASLLTAIDLLVDNVDLSRPVSMERSDTIRAEVSNLTSRIIYSDITGSLLALVDSEIEKNTGPMEFNRVLIYSDKVKGLYALQSRLRNDDFTVVTTGTPEEFASEHKHHLPNLVILHFSSGPTAVIKALNQFLNKGLSIGSVPAFVLAKDTVVGRLTPLLDMGIEEILDLESQLDILVHKMKKTRAGLKEAYESRKAQITARSISQGDLAHMSIIDLLQALGPGRRTSRITVSRSDISDVLILYLDKGKITAADFGSLAAEKAIYEVMKWDQGNWKVEPIDESDLPEPNVTDSNEAILMEGCRLMDEQSKPASS